MPDEDIADFETDKVSRSNDFTNYEPIEPYEPSTSKSHKRVVKTGTSIVIPHDVMKSPLFVATTIRNKITPTALSATLHSFIKSCSGDSAKVNINPSQATRYRVATAETIAESINTNWSSPSVAALHWDGKLMETLGDKYQ